LVFTRLFQREDLENLLYIRQNAKPLSSIEINNEIVDPLPGLRRSYQHEAIRRLGEAVVNRKRKSLIVMPKRNLPREPDDRYPA
jgi:type I site-specific restriction endonuclease